MSTRIANVATGQTFQRVWIRYLAAVLIVVGFAVVRLEFLRVMGNSAPYLIFFPAVIMAALYGGRGPGLLATLLAGLSANYFWVEPTGSFKISNTPDVIAFVIFLANGGLVSWLTKAMLHAQAQSRLAESQAQLAVERQRAMESQVLLAAIINCSADAIIGRTRNGIITSWNRGAERIFGYATAEVIGKLMPELIPPECEVAARDHMIRVQGGEPIENFETERRHKEGRILHVSIAISPIADVSGMIVGISEVIRDITRRKLQEQELLRMNRLYSALSQVNQSIVWTKSRGELLSGICRVMIEFGHFELAWVGWLSPETKEIAVAAHHGANGTADYLKGIHVYADERPEGGGPAGICIREGRAHVCNDFCNDPAAMPWHETAVRHGLAACVSVPIRKGGAICGVLVVYAAEKNFFSDKEVALLVEAALDISFGLDRFAADEERQRISRWLARTQRVSKVGGWVFNLQAGEVWISPEARRIYGAPNVGSLTIDHVQSYPLPQYRSLLDAALRDLVAGKSPYDIEFRIARGNDGVIVDIHSVAEYDQEEGTVLGVIEDITQRKQIETALKESEARFRNLFYDNGSVMLLMDPDSGIIMDANRVAAEYYGYPPTLLVGMSISQINVLPATELAAERELARREERNYFNFRHRLASGEIREVEVYSTPVGVGAKPLLLSIVHDITERKRSEQKLLQVLAAVESSSNAIGISDLQGRHFYQNKAYTELFGYRTAEELQALGGGAATVYDPTVAKELFDTILAGRSWSGELKLITKGGHIFDAYERADAIRDQSGKMIGLMGVVTDITERKQAEDQLRLQTTALTAAANAIIITDSSGKIEWVNPAFTTLTGYSAAEAVGNYPSLLKSGHHSRAFYTSLWTTIVTGGVWHGELVNKRKDGKLCTEETTITPVRQPSGEIRHFVAIKQDVTERRQLENQLRQAQKMEAIGTLAGGIAHDFNNILGAMMGFGSLLQEDTEGNAAAQESVAEILKAADRAKELVK